MVDKKLPGSICMGPDEFGPGGGFFLREPEEDEFGETLGHIGRQDVARAVVKRYNAHDGLVKLAHTFIEACESRVDLLEDEEKGWRPEDELNDMVAHWTALQNEAEEALKNSGEEV